MLCSVWLIKVVEVLLILLEQLKPNFCDAWSNLASAYMRKGMLQEAAECCRHALSLNPRLVRYTCRPSSLWSNYESNGESLNGFVGACVICGCVIFWFDIIIMFRVNGMLLIHPVRKGWRYCWVTLGWCTQQLGKSTEGSGLDSSRTVLVRVWCIWNEFCAVFRAYRLLYWPWDGLACALVLLVLPERNVFLDAVPYGVEILYEVSNWSCYLHLEIESFEPFDSLAVSWMLQAYLCYVEALRIQPTFAIAWSNLAGLLMEAGELQRALNYYKVWHILASPRALDSILFQSAGAISLVNMCLLKLQYWTCWVVLFIPLLNNKTSQHMFYYTAVSSEAFQI